MHYYFKSDSSFLRRVKMTDDAGIELYWVDSSRIPGDRASSKQVVKTCNELGKLCKAFLLTPRWVSDTRNYGVDVGAHFQLKSVYFKLIRVPFPREKFYLFNFLALVFLLKALGQKRAPLLIYTRGLNAAVFFKKILKNRACIICELHPLPLRSVHKNVVRLNGIVAVTKELREAMIRGYGIKESNIIVEPCAADMDEFELEEDIRRTVDEEISVDFGVNSKIVLYAGQLYKSKNTNILLDLAGSVKGKEGNIRILIVGGWEDEPEVHALREEIRRRRLELYIKVTGSKPYRMIPYYLRRADALFLTDIGAKFFEYCASQKPIVAADTALMREWVSEDEVYFYRQGDLMSCHDAVLRALEDNGEKSSRSHAFAKEHTFALRAKRIYDFMVSLYLKS